MCHFNNHLSGKPVLPRFYSLTSSKTEPFVYLVHVLQVECLHVSYKQCQCTKQRITFRDTKCTKVLNYLCLFRAKPNVEEYLPCWAYFTIKELNLNVWVRSWWNICHVLHYGFTKFWQSCNTKWYNFIQSQTYKINKGTIKQTKQQCHIIWSLSHLR